MKFTDHFRAVQFRRLVDFMFFVRDFLLPGDALPITSAMLTHIVIIIDNQKNAICGETVSHFRYESAAACSVKVGIDNFLRLRDRGCDPTTPITNLPSDYGLRTVSASNIIAIIRAGCLQVGSARVDFAPEDAGKHSLRSGGAMAMHLTNVPDRTLMAIDRWWSLGLMVYTQ